MRMTSQNSQAISSASAFLFDALNVSPPEPVTSSHNEQEYDQYDDNVVFVEEGNPSEPPLEHIVAKRARQTGFHCIGKLRTAILSFSMISSIAALFFLYWLWNGNPDDPAPIWGRLVDGQWVAQSITVVAFLIRTAISAQAIVATSMLAAILLETNGVRLQDAAEFSILRFSNPGPLLSLQIFLRNNRGVKNWPIFTLILSLALMTTVLQFISTILLTDVRGSLFLGPRKSSIRWSGTRYLNKSDIDYWTLDPISTAHILEYSEPAIPRNNVADTGVSVRGFLPILNETERSQLRYYEGMAALFDTRVVCSRPSVNLTEFGFINDGIPDTDQIARPLRLRGTVQGNLMLPELMHNITEQVVGFDCSANKGDYALMHLCSLASGSPGDTYQPFMGLASRLLPSVPPAPKTVMSRGHAWLLWDFPRSCYDNPRTNCLLKQTKTPVEQSGPWQSFNAADLPSSNEVVRVSLCYDALDSLRPYAWPVPYDYNVYFNTSTQLPPEPVFATNRSSHPVDTTNLRRPLGATKDSALLSVLERDVMYFDIKPIDEQISTASMKGLDPAQSTTYPFLWGRIWTHNTPLFDTTSYNFRLLFSYLVCNGVLVGMFLDTLEETRNPAIALQALFTTVLRSAYYDAVPYFDYSQETVMRLVSLKPLPTGHSGLSAVTVLVGLHLALVLAVITLFVLRGKAVNLHNPWAVIMEMWAPEGREFLDDDGGIAMISIVDEDGSRIVRLSLEPTSSD